MALESWLPLAVGLVLLVAFAVAPAIGGFARRRRALAEIATTWGQPLRSRRGDTFLDAWARCHRDDDTDEVDDVTWRDLELERVFASIDATLTAPGAQVLRAWLRQPLRTPSPDHLRWRWVDVLGRDPDRPRIQRILADLGDLRGWSAARLLDGDLPAIRAPAWLFRLLPIAMVLALAIGILGNQVVALSIGLALAFTNPLVHYGLGRRLLGHVDALHGLQAIVATAGRLRARVPPQVRASVPDVDDDLELVRGALRLSEPEGTSGIPALELGRDYQRAFFLTDLVAYQRAAGAIARHRAAFRRLFAFVGSVDAAISIAYRTAEGSGWCRPSWHPERRWIAERLAHPLLAEPVANDVDLGPTGWIVTGANMAGKSTFLRTVALNASLAQSLGWAFAHAYRSCPARVLTSIEAVDDPERGISLYQAEVLRIGEVLARAGEGRTCLVVIDEPFRGTNPSERVAAGAAVLLELVDQHLVVAATHDRDLVRKLGPAFESRHFAETIVDGRVVFDYAVRSGSAGRTNAIALLERLGYPPHVVERARDLARDT